jgi:hypothetical protein
MRQRMKRKDLEKETSEKRNKERERTNNRIKEKGI